MAHSYDQNKPIILNLIKKLKPKTILDIGIGAGDYGPLIREAVPQALLMGVDSHEGYKTDKWQHYRNVVIADMRKYRFPKVDLTLFIDSLEHINKEEALTVLYDVPNDVLVSIPIGYTQYKPDFWDTHRSEWTLKDFKGYEYLNYSNELSLILLIKKGKK